MFKSLGKYLGAGTATAAMFVAGSIALADPPAYGPRGDEVAPRAAARADARADVRADRIDRRAHRAPGELGLRLGNIADHGLAIANLVTDSVFYNAGIRPGDYIVSIDGHQLTGPDQFDQYLYANGPNQPVTIVVWRNGADQTLTLQPNVLYANDNAAYNYNDDLAYFGVEFDPQYANELYISRVLPGTYAYRAGLRAGDVITNWDGRTVRTPQDFARMIHDEKPGRVAFDYSRGSQRMNANVDFDRRADQGPGDRTAQRVTRNYPPADTNRPEQNPQEPNRVNPNGQEPNRVNPNAPTAPREPIPTLNPPATPREPTPTLNPPSNPREPIPTVNPPAPHSPSPGVNPPVPNPPAAENPPAPSNPHPAEPQGAAPQGTAPRGR